MPYADFLDQKNSNFDSNQKQIESVDAKIPQNNLGENYNKQNMILQRNKSQSIIANDFKNNMRKIRSKRNAKMHMDLKDYGFMNSTRNQQNFNHSSQ